MRSALLAHPKTKQLAIPALGCALIVLGAWIRIPFYPVPMTLQTFALFLIALTQSPKQAFYSTSSYLLLATLGLPVFFCHTNPCWWMGKCGGYLWAFPIAAYWIATMKSRIGPFWGAASGAALILCCGALWLTPFVGAQLAFNQGLLCFIPCELSKILAAMLLVKWRRS